MSKSDDARPGPGKARPDVDYLYGRNLQWALSSSCSRVLQDLQVRE